MKTKQEAHELALLTKVLADEWAFDLPVGTHMFSWTEAELRTYGQAGGFWSPDSKEPPPKKMASCAPVSFDEVVLVNPVRVRVYPLISVPELRPLPHRVTHSLHTAPAGALCT